MRAFAFVLLLLAGCATQGGVEGIRHHYDLKPQVRRGDPGQLEAAGRWLDAGELRFEAGGTDSYRQAAYDALRWLDSTDGAGPEEIRRAQRLYNHAVAAYVLETRANDRPGAWCYSAYNVKSRLPDEYHEVNGFGAPFVIVTEGRCKEFGEGLVTGAHDEIMPTTAVLEFVGGGPRVSFHDPWRKCDVKLEGRTVPLNADVMAALELRLEATHYGDWRRDAALNPGMDQAGFSLLEPPQSDKIPVLVLHGLQHAPTDFAEMFATLSRNPTIRTRYQFICYRWATGLPLPVSVGIFQRKLGEFWPWFEEQAPGARGRGYWVISHSMGGLLAKTLVVDSGDRILQKMFRVPLSEVDLDTDLGKRIRRALVYRPDPNIAGVIFMAVPHRGSGVASSVIADIGTELIDPGDQMLELLREIEDAYGDQLDPEVLRELHKKTTGLQSLRPNDWYLKALSECPISSATPYHSVIGDLFGTELWPVGDGAVAYKSAHLAGAASETVVRAPHNLHKTRIGLEAVERILLANLAKP